MGSSLVVWILLCGFKIPEVFKQECFRLLWFSKDIYTLMEQSKKDKSKIYFQGDKESDDMVSDLNKMEYLAEFNRCYCLNLNQKKL
jgi:hypothetical protein